MRQNVFRLTLCDMRTKGIEEKYLWSIGEVMDYLKANSDTIKNPVFKFTMESIISGTICEDRENAEN